MRSQAPGPNVGRRMSVVGHTRLTLELAHGEDAICGRVIDQDGSATSFRGWLELMVALEDANGERERERSVRRTQEEQRRLGL